MHRTLGILVAMFASAGIVCAGNSAEGGAAPLEVPRLGVWTRLLLPGMDGFDDSIADSNPHEVTVSLRPTDGEEFFVLTRYTVIPGEPGEWMTETWNGYRFQIYVRLYGPTKSTARVITSCDGVRLTDQYLGLMIRPNVYDAEDPEVLRDRLERAEKVAGSYSETFRRIQTARFRPKGDHWLDANCTLEDNQWKITNKWVIRELDYDLVRAQYPTDLSADDDRRKAEFFAQWREGDRIFSSFYPDRFGGTLGSGYIIVRGCRVVDMLGLMVF